jgi:hypothetical protein
MFFTSLQLGLIGFYPCKVCEFCFTPVISFVEITPCNVQEFFSSSFLLKAINKSIQSNVTRTKIIKDISDIIKDN